MDQQKLLNKQKKLLILNGPILSVGSTGNFEKDIPRDQRVNVSFDVIENVKAYSRAAKQEAVEIAYVIWESDCNPDTLKKLCSLENLLVIPIKEPSNIPRQYLQFYSLLHGLEYLKKSGGIDETYKVIRIRSDLYVNLSKLVSELEDNNVKIQTAHLVYDGRFQDFFFAANYLSIKSFLLNILKNEYICNPNIHFDSVLKQSRFFRLLASMGLKIPSKIVVIICPFISKKMFSAFSEDLYRTCEWRGEKLNHHFFSNMHLFKRSCS